MSPPTVTNPYAKEGRSPPATAASSSSVMHQRPEEPSAKRRKSELEIREMTKSKDGPTEANFRFFRELRKAKNLPLETTGEELESDGLHMKFVEWTYF